MQAQKCKREMILTYFGFSVPQTLVEHDCCDFYKEKCVCEDCALVSHLSAIEINTENIECSSDGSIPADSCQLNAEQMDSLLEELQRFRLSLPGTGPSCVGSTSLVTGISLDLLQQIAQNASSFHSPQDMEKKLPFFSHSHAFSIWEILKKYQ